MASNPHYNHGLLWRALLISLLAHGIVLLQPGIGLIPPRATGDKVLLALLKPKSDPGSVSVPIVAAQPQHSTLQGTESKVSRTDPIVDPAIDGLQLPAKMVDGTQESTASNPVKTTADATRATGDADFDFVESRKSYLFAIAAEARRLKKYPPRAFAARWTGTAEIRINVTMGGNAQPPQLQKSSGYTEIDDAALTFVGLALKRTPVPESLRSRSFEFYLPVTFSIKDE